MRGRASRCQLPTYFLVRNSPCIHISRPRNVAWHIMHQPQRDKIIALFSGTSTRVCSLLISACGAVCNKSSSLKHSVPDSESKMRIPFRGKRAIEEAHVNECVVSPCASVLQKTRYFLASHQSKKNQKATRTAIRKIVFPMFRSRCPSFCSIFSDSDDVCIFCLITPHTLCLSEFN